MTWAKTALEPTVQKVGAVELTLGLARWVERGSRAKWDGDTLGLDDAKGAAHTHQRSSSPLERAQKTEEAAHGMAAFIDGSRGRGPARR